ncbi:MAG: (2Fe-2S)-binding protein [Candidatus Sumerlaeota bacterium]|nr:(2Fe-2S)-binding protein [Candidatus Sumerlaeota bacterium]
MLLKVKINGEDKVLTIATGERLLDLLRREGYFSVKEGCRQGNCGACVVLLDGRAVNSCMVFAARCEGREIITAEGLGTPARPHPLQEAFVNAGAVQCGYCTPGMLLSSQALLAENPAPSVEEIKTALDGNLCRCTGYVKIIKAVQDAAKRMKGAKGR